MDQRDLPTIRLLARNQAYTITNHALDQMFERDISYDDIDEVLSSTSNQLIETQPPSMTPGRQHKDERFLIFDPCYHNAIILVCVVVFIPSPEIRIITAELVDSNKWESHPGEDPALVRIA